MLSYPKYDPKKSAIIPAGSYGIKVHQSDEYKITVYVKEAAQPHENIVDLGILNPVGELAAIAEERFRENAVVKQYFSPDGYAHCISLENAATIVREMWDILGYAAYMDLNP